MSAAQSASGNIGLVIFGVTGDLTHRKLVPALYQLALSGHLPANLHIIGFARRDWSDDHLRQEMQTSLEQYARTQPLDQAVLKDLLGRMHYVRSDFDDMDGYKRLGAFLESIGADNRLYIE